MIQLFPWNDCCSKRYWRNLRQQKSRISYSKLTMEFKPAAMYQHDGMQNSWCIWQFLDCNHNNFWGLYDCLKFFVLSCWRISNCFCTALPWNATATWACASSPWYLVHFSVKISYVWLYSLPKPWLCINPLIKCFWNVFIVILMTFKPFSTLSLTLNLVISSRISHLEASNVSATYLQERASTWRQCLKCLWHCCNIWLNHLHHCT